VRNTQPAAVWDRVEARWSPAPAEAPPDGSLDFVSLDGLRAFSLRPLRDENGPATSGEAWVPFARRQWYPPGAPSAPDAPYILVVRAAADEERDREDFRRWLGEEHGPRQTTIPGVNWLVAYEEEGATHSFLNLWGLDDPAVVDGEAWVEVRRSPWWDRVAHVPATADRGVYRRGRAPGA
jgi:hypothetical protein